MSGRVPRPPVKPRSPDLPPVPGNKGATIPQGATAPQAATPPAGGTVRKGQKAPPVEKKLPADIDETLNGYAKQFHAGQNLPRFQVRMENLMNKGLSPDRIIKEMQSRGILVTHDPATKRWTLKDTVAQAEAPPTNIPGDDPAGPVTSADDSLPPTTEARDEQLAGMSPEQRKLDLYEDAVEAVRGEGRASVAVLQYKLKVDYNTAIRLLDQMEAAGVVGPSNQSGLRKILADGDAPASKPAGRTTGPSDEVRASLIASGMTDFAVNSQFKRLGVKEFTKMAKKRLGDNYPGPERTVKEVLDDLTRTANGQGAPPKTAPKNRPGTVDKSAEMRDNENTVLANSGLTNEQIAGMTPEERQLRLDSIRRQATESSPLKTGSEEAAAQAAETAAANGAVVPASPPAPPTGDATPAPQTVATPTPSRFRRISDDDADALLRTGLYDEAHIDRMDAMASDEAIARAVQDARLRAPVAPPPNPLAGLSSLGITTSPTGGVTVPSPAATTPPPSPAPAPQPMPQPMPGPGPLAGLGINVATPGLPPAGPPMPPASPAGQAVNPYMARLSASQNPSTKMIQALSAWNRNQQSPGVSQPQPQTQAPPKKTLIERLGMRPTKIDPVPALYRNAPAVAASLAKGLGYGLIGTGIGYGVDRATGGNFVRWLTGGQGGQDEDAEYYEALKGLSQPIWPNGVPPQFQTKPGE